MKISEDYSMPIFSIPIRTKEFSSSYKSLFDMIQNEVGFEISFENIYLGSSEIKDGTIGDIIQQVKDASQKISVNCQLTNNSVQIINKRISAVNHIIEFESNYVTELRNQTSSNIELKSNLHANFLNGLRDSFCGYASQVGWAFLNSFGINNDDYENTTTIINDLVNIVPIEIKDLFENLLSLTPMCHPDNFFLDQSIQILIRLSALKKSINNENVNKEEEEEVNSLNQMNNSNGDDSQENFLMQNIDDYSMSTDEFVTTVEHILGQKDDIKINKNYDDENGRRPKQNILNDDPSKGENENEAISNFGQSNANFNKEDSSSNNSKIKETDYSRFFLFGKNNNFASNDDLNGINLLFSSKTPTKKASFVFNSDSKLTPVSNPNDFLFNMPDFTDSERKNKTPIIRSIKLDSSKKYAYTPEERRNKAKQISKFIKSTKENQLNNFSPFSLFTSPPPQKVNHQISQKENSQPTYNNDYNFLSGKKPKNSTHSVNNSNFNISDEDLSSLEQSNQLTEIIDFNIDDDVNIDDSKKKNQVNYRKILSPDANSLNSDDYLSQKRKPKSQSKTKNVQFNTNEF